MKIRYFMIRNKATGLYSSGSSYPVWSEGGKKWNHKGHAKNHIANAVGWNHADEIYGNAEIVEFEYEYNPVEVNKVDVKEYIDEKNEERRQYEIRQAERRSVLEYEQAKKIIAEHEAKGTPMT